MVKPGFTCYFKVCVCLGISCPCTYLDPWVHFGDDLCRSLRLELVNVPWPEEELSVEVGLFDGVHVGNDHFAKAHHGEVFQQLAPDGAGTNHEKLLLAHMGLKKSMGSFH